MVAGHSVGEFAAAALTGMLSPEVALVLVRERGALMAEASRRTPTGMSAVLGGEADHVLAKLAELRLVAANVNGAGQIVAAGTLDQLQALADSPPEKARIRPLQVAGAFHTQHMAPAVDALGRLARSVSTHDPRTPVISNADGKVVHDGREVVKRIVTQVSNPVRWDLCMETMSDLGVTGVLEVPPAGTLVGLVKRALPGVETFALKEPGDLDAARDFCDKHGEASALDSSPTWRLLVAPAKGRFSRAAAAEGESLEPAEEIGTISSLRDSTPVVAPYGGVIVEWLVEDGDLVSPGQPLVRLHPEGVPA